MPCLLHGHLMVFQSSELHITYFGILTYRNAKESLRFMASTFFWMSLLAWSWVFKTTEKISKYVIFIEPLSISQITYWLRSFDKSDQYWVLRRLQTWAGTGRLICLKSGRFPGIRQTSWIREMKGVRGRELWRKEESLVRGGNGDSQWDEWA